MVMIIAVHYGPDSEAEVKKISLMTSFNYSNDSFSR